MGDRCWEHGDGDCLGCLKSLGAENARLREALEYIAGPTDKDLGKRPHGSMWHVRYEQRARQALGLPLPQPWPPGALPYCGEG